MQQEYQRAEINCMLTKMQNIKMKLRFLINCCRAKFCWNVEWVRSTIQRPVTPRVHSGL